MFTPDNTLIIDDEAAKVTRCADNAVVVPPFDIDNVIENDDTILPHLQQWLTLLLATEEGTDVRDFIKAVPFLPLLPPSTAARTPTNNPSSPTPSTPHNPNRPRASTNPPANSTTSTPRAVSVPVGETDTPDNRAILPLPRRPGAIRHANATGASATPGQADDDLPTSFEEHYIVWKGALAFAEQGKVPCVATVDLVAFDGSETVTPSFDYALLFDGLYPGFPSKASFRQERIQDILQSAHLFGAVVTGASADFDDFARSVWASDQLPCAFLDWNRQTQAYLVPPSWARSTGTKKRDIDYLIIFRSSTLKPAHKRTDIYFLQSDLSLLPPASTRNTKRPRDGPTPTNSPSGPSRSTTTTVSTATTATNTPDKPNTLYLRLNPRENASRDNLILYFLNRFLSVINNTGKLAKLSVDHGATETVVKMRFESGAETDVAFGVLSFVGGRVGDWTIMSVSRGRL
ncbi:hypothetical protein HDV00_011969 [Rhizophlyctis rosea]|nr:hypothetical protein HDV00_011969 [Rhizophlyctis rosea]